MSANPVPAVTDRPVGTPTAPLLQLRDVRKHFRSRGGGQDAAIRAVDGVSLEVAPGETLGVVGESGSGKSTLGRCMVRLLEPTSGSIVFDGQDITRRTRKQLRSIREHVQFVFQDPYASLNPRMVVRDALAEPLRIHGWSSHRADLRVEELLELVGLRPEHAERLPHEFSGGQRQRVVIARALALSPKLLVLDECVSALDLSVQAQILNLLVQLQQQLDLTYVFISHDLGVVRHIADRVAVMYVGKVVEIADSDALYEQPHHPYTRALLSAVPVTDPDDRTTRGRIVLEGDLPNPADPPSGCRFRTRCWLATDQCAHEEPVLAGRLDPARPTACHFPALVVAPE